MASSEPTPSSSDLHTELAPATRAIVASTAPILAEHGVAITTRMYKRLFASNPDITSMFDGAPDGQATRLANAVLAYAENIDQIEVLLPAVQSIASKHVSAGVQPEHYPIVGTELLGAMVDVLGPLGDDVVGAWSDAFSFLAGVLVNTEAGLVADAA